MKGLPELLAPAGSSEAVSAAIKAGADAVYVGGKFLNARMNAKNLSDSELSECIKRCHANGVRFHVTLNTAVFDKELEQAVNYADMLYMISADALIVSDTGLASLLKDRYQGMELHASTQAGGHNAECAKAFAALGFSRMVCARELSYVQIKELCAASPIGIEQFIHGAMCVSQSSQCMASLVMGGRSGNRGVCAQPCRKMYNGCYPLSLKDMCLANHISELTDSGVVSLKIEGRMKSPAYVYQTVKIYRTLLDEGRNISQKELEKLRDVFSRSGFTDRYFTGNPDNTMLGVRTAEDKINSSRIKTDFAGTPRAAAQITVTPRKKPDSPVLPDYGKKTSKRKALLTARFSDPRQVTGSDFFRHIYLPLEKFEKDVCDGVIMPPAVFPGNEKNVDFLLSEAVKNGAKEVLVTSPGQIETVKKFGMNIHGDFRLNIFNTASALYYISEGLRDVMLSPELSLPQMRDISAPKSAIVYGRIPIMLLTKRLGLPSLRDSTGAVFPVTSEAGFDILLNSVPIYMADRQKALSDHGIIGQHFIFTTETGQECAGIIENYRIGKPPQSDKFRRIPK